MDKDNFKINAVDGYVELTDDALIIEGPRLVEQAIKGHLRTAIKPRIKKLFDAGNDHVLLCVGQYWDDEADDATHQRLVAVKGPIDLSWFDMEPKARWERHVKENEVKEEDLSEWAKEDLELRGHAYLEMSDVFEGNHLSWGELYGDHGDNMSLFRYWSDNGWAIDLYSMFAPYDGDQEKDEWENYAPAALFSKEGGIEVFEPHRGWGQDVIHITRRYRPDAPENPVIKDILAGLAVNALLGE